MTLVDSKTCEWATAGSVATIRSGKDTIARNFQRDVHCLLGLPVDNLSLPAAKTLIREVALFRKNFVLSTININWVARSFSDPEFYTAILNSDLVTIDGKPLLWLARLFGCPMQETVPGSTLIMELLEEKTDRPLTIFLFGGEGDAAEGAMERINARRGGLRAVGAYNPGYGTVEEMSVDRIINTINSADPDILLVALGAAKGVEWIEKNRHRLNTGIISHLGATINFLAGTVKRAPRFMQAYGLEWLWRIFQEPKLFSRYTWDGLVLFKMLLGRAPLWLAHRARCRRLSRYPADNLNQYQENQRRITLTLGSCLRVDRNARLCALLRRAVLTNKELILDFQATRFVDSAFLGLLLILQKYQTKNGRKLTLINVNGKLTQLFRLFCINDGLVRGAE